MSIGNVLDHDIPMSLYSREYKQQLYCSSFFIIPVPASAMAMPMLVGNFVAPSVMDRRGRKVASYVGIAPVLLGWIIIIMADNFQVNMISLCYNKS